MRKTAVYLICFMIGSISSSLYGSYPEARVVSTVATSHQGPELHLDRALVKNVQRALTEQGFYSGPIDGQIGPQTREALKNFQRAYRLPVTGQLDEETVKKLGVSLEEERKETKSKGVFGKIGSGVKSASGAVATGAVTAAKATKEGAVTGAETAGEGATVAAKKSAQGSTTAAKATVKGTTSAGKAVKGVVVGRRGDDEILYDIQEKFKEDSQIDPTHIDVGVSDGVVTLTLRKGKPLELDRAAALARQVEGVKKVVTSWK